MKRSRPGRRTSGLTLRAGSTWNRTGTQSGRVVEGPQGRRVRLRRLPSQVAVGRPFRRAGQTLGRTAVIQLVQGVATEGAFGGIGLGHGTNAQTSLGSTGLHHRVGTVRVRVATNAVVRRLARKVPEDRSRILGLTDCSIASRSARHHELTASQAGKATVVAASSGPVASLPARHLHDRVQAVVASLTRRQGLLVRLGAVRVKERVLTKVRTDLVILLERLTQRRSRRESTSSRMLLRVTTLPRRSLRSLRNWLRPVLGQVSVLIFRRVMLITRMSRFGQGPDAQSCRKSGLPPMWRGGCEATILIGAGSNERRPRPSIKMLWPSRGS